MLERQLCVYTGDDMWVVTDTRSGRQGKVTDVAELFSNYIRFVTTVNKQYNKTFVILNILLWRVDILDFPSKVIVKVDENSFSNENSLTIGTLSLDIREYRQLYCPI